MGRVGFVAPDPSEDDRTEDPGGVEPEWIVVANLLFLSGVAAYSGPSSSTITCAMQREPEIVTLMDKVGDATLRKAPLREALSPAWPAIEAAARERGKRGG